VEVNLLALVVVLIGAGNIEDLAQHLLPDPAIPVRGQNSDDHDVENIVILGSVFVVGLLDAAADHPDDDALVVRIQLVLAELGLENLLVELRAVVHGEDVLVQLPQRLDVAVIDLAELDLQFRWHLGCVFNSRPGVVRRQQNQQSHLQEEEQRPSEKKPRKGQGEILSWAGKGGRGRGRAAGASRGRCAHGSS